MWLHLTAACRCRCALCHQTEVDEGDGNQRQEHGLGQLKSVRVSAIQLAWVHAQCALWSPEVSLRACHLLTVMNRDAALTALDS